MLIPGIAVPELKIETVGHGLFDLKSDRGENGTLVIQYRGLHCPICIRQMAEVEAALGDFSELGVEVIMITTDTAVRAAEAVAKAGTEHLRVGHGLSLPSAQNDWGLYISEGRAGTAEAALFAEPGHFYVAPDQTLYFAWTQSAPFGRPSVADMIGGIKFALDKNYPPRGTYTGPL